MGQNSNLGNGVRPVLDGVALPLRAQIRSLGFLLESPLFLDSPMMVVARSAHSHLRRFLEKEDLGTVVHVWLHPDLLTVILCTEHGGWAALQDKTKTVGTKCCGTSDLLWLLLVELPFHRSCFGSLSISVPNLRLVEVLYCHGTGYLKEPSAPMENSSRPSPHSICGGDLLYYNLSES